MQRRCRIARSQGARPEWLLSAGSIDVRSLVSAEVSLRRAVEGLEIAATPGALKVLVRNDL